MDETVSKETTSDIFSENYWNYRWLKTVVECDEYDDNGNQTGNKYNEVYYQLHEVYYDNNEKPFMYSEQPMTFYADNLEDMLLLLSRAFEASKKPVLQIVNEKIIELDECMQQKYKMEEN